ncbi:putative ribonuclease H-like domain-containing protein [Tanacetum coccineum]
MEFESANSNTTAKLPILKLGEYEMCVIRIKQYFQIQDYALWKVIENDFRRWYYQRIGKKTFINANDIAGYDKSKVECFNCHKMEHFARDCRAPRNKEGQFRNQDNTRKHGNNEDTSSKAMLDIDGVEFKNKVMDDFCKEKGIKREYSVAKTPQQNGVAERRNRTLIEAARIMLADSKLPTTFWAEAVSTACYVQNRVLVVKPHNKTPYELFRGFKPALSFMRPFGCHVTILNTLDSLGKFDGKSDEGFFVGYSLSSKAFRVYNTRTRRVEENLHIGFLENKPMIEGNGPKWLFDIDSLTQSMNYDQLFAGQSLMNMQRTQGVLVCHLKATLLEFYSDEDELEVDLGNITNSYTVLTTPNTRIHKDHLIKNVIGDVKTFVQTRRMTKPTFEQGFSLVAQGHRQEEGIDYEEVFALWARIEEEVYVTQPPRFKDPDHPYKVYKVVKALYGLHQAPRACQDKYVAEILKKFKYTDVKSASTPVDLENPLVKDGDADDVDVHLYRSMIGSLMYLTAFRPDIMFAVCACARFQVTPKTSHLLAVKRIFRYLKGKPTLGLWYSRDSLFELVAYTDIDYVGETQERKSTTEGCQFLGNMLISWQCKKQIMVVTSTMKSEIMWCAS